MAVRRRGEVQFPFQLTMFEQAGSLDRDFTHNDTTALDPQRVRDQKLLEGSMRGSSVSAHIRMPEFKEARIAGAPSLEDSIRSGGVQQPVETRLAPGGTKDVFDGHHRMYTAASINPSLEVPVTWNDDRAPSGLNAGQALDYRNKAPMQPGMDEAKGAVMASEARRDAETEAWLEKGGPGLRAAVDKLSTALGAR